MGSLRLVWAQGLTLCHAALKIAGHWHVGILTDLLQYTQAARVTLASVQMRIL